MHIENLKSNDVIDHRASRLRVAPASRILRENSSSQAKFDGEVCMDSKSPSAS